MATTNGTATTRPLMAATAAQAKLALGRILRLGARAAQPSDVDEYERCRRLILDALAPVTPFVDHAPNYARDRRKGAAGD